MGCTARLDPVQARSCCQELLRRTHLAPVANLLLCLPDAALLRQLQGPPELLDRQACIMTRLEAVSGHLLEL